MSIPEEYALNNLCAPGTLKLMVLYLFARASHLQTTVNDMECTMMLFVEVTYFHYSQEIRVGCLVNIIIIISLEIS